MKVKEEQKTWKSDATSSLSQVKILSQDNSFFLQVSVAMIPEVIEKGMLDFGRFYKYNQI